MTNTGYTKIPRLTDRSLTGRAIAVLEYICENVRIHAERETELGVEEVGEMLTTRSRLVKRFRTTAQKIRSDLKMLAEAGYIEIETSTRCTRIRVIWQDFALLNGYDIMLNNQADNQANNQPTTLVSSDISNGCEDLKNKITNRITNRITNINNKDIYNDNIHTERSNYLVETKSAPARETHAHASATSEERDRFFKIFSLIRKFTQPQREVERFVAYYDASGWCRKGSNIPVKDKEALALMWAPEDSAPNQGDCLLTHQQMTAELAKLGGSQSNNQFKYFDTVYQPDGKPALYRWRIS